jgi:ElaB/YqjD/DUF883 family membrane-anchored ribosome-binding protein
MIKMNSEIADMNIDELRAEFLKFRDDVAAMKSRFVDAAGAAVDDVTAQAPSYSDIRGLIESKISDLEDELRKLSKRVKHESKHAMHKVEGEVKDRPLTAIALAFGVGLLGAQLLRR